VSVKSELRDALREKCYWRTSWLAYTSTSNCWPSYCRGHGVVWLVTTAVCLEAHGHAARYYTNLFCTLNRHVEIVFNDASLTIVMCNENI